MAILNAIRLDISVLPGQSTMPIHQVLRMGCGAVIELDAICDSGATILANNLPIARRSMLVTGNCIVVQVKEVPKRGAETR